MCVDTFKNSRCLSQPRFRLCSVLTAIVFCLTAAQIAAAATYYVDPTGGSDTYPGTSTQPWKSMDMVRLSSAAGDTIRIVTVDAGACAAKWPEGRTFRAFKFVAPGTHTVECRSSSGVLFSRTVEIELGKDTPIFWGP